jgi:hypothetical protein
MSQNKVENVKVSMSKIDNIEEGKIMKYFNGNEVKIVKTNKREYKICNLYEENYKRKRV